MHVDCNSEIVVDIMATLQCAQIAFYKVIHDTLFIIMLGF